MRRSLIGFFYVDSDRNNDTRPVICLMGPTASGKSEIAVKLAKALDGEVISVDSAMVYRGMDIGTAKPGPADMGGIPHHLIDILDPSEPFSTGQFCERATSLVQAIRARHRVPVLAGGTMLYFKSLRGGLARLPAANPAIRRQIDDEAGLKGWRVLHQQLAEVDPESAARIHPNDPQRIQRALEVYRVSGKSLSQLFNSGIQPPRIRNAVRVILVPEDRSVLHKKISDRFLGMLDNGLVAEVESLYRRGDLDASLPSIRAVGYRQVWSYLDGEIDHSAMIEKAVIATRQLAKRQLTWLRRESGGIRIDCNRGRLFEEILKDLEPLIR